MYGYVRPFKPDLTFRQYDHYKAAYCGLCHALSKRHGFAARFAVSYDMTLPVLFQKEVAFCRKTCPTKPLKRCETVAYGPYLERIADASVILVWYKLADQKRDKGFWGKIGGKLLSLFVKKAYGKASVALPAFDEACRVHLSRLHQLEEAGCAVPDEAADCFAQLLAILSFLGEDEAEKRVFREFYYHIGRVIYLLDAYDDAYEDGKRGQYNPLLAKHGEAAKLTQEVRQELAETIELSLARAASAVSLLPNNDNTPIVDNIVYKGLPAVTRAVLSVPPTALGARQKRRRFRRGKREITYESI
jgi:hypothetical protein